MMVGRFRIPVGYSSDLECRIAELPFSSRRVSLFIILPDDVDRGLAKLEQSMSSDNVKALFSTLKVIHFSFHGNFIEIICIFLLRRQRMKWSTVRFGCGG